MPLTPQEPTYNGFHLSLTVTILNVGFFGRAPLLEHRGQDGNAVHALGAHLGSIYMRAQAVPQASC